MTTYQRPELGPDPTLRDLLRAVTPRTANHVSGPFNASLVESCQRVIGHDPLLSDLDDETLAKIKTSIVDRFDPIDPATGKRAPRTKPAAQAAARRVQRLDAAIAYGRLRATVEKSDAER